LTLLPEWEEKLTKEAEELFRHEEKTTELVSKMENFTAFVKETLRYYPPAPSILMRVAKHDVMINDLKIKKKTILATHFMANHFNPKYFNNPQEFNPTRWLPGDKSEEGWKKEPFAYLPFSSGPRNCIGQHLAQLEAKLTIASILKNYRVSIDKDFKLDMSMGEGFLLYLPERPIPFILTPRKD